VIDAAAGAWHSAGMHEVARDDAWLDDQLAARLAAMPYAKRRDEARLGRWTAKSTVAAVLGLDPSHAGSLREVIIRNAPDGAPEAFWRGSPAGVTIAMTDRADWAVCAVTAPEVRVGCDLEVVEPRSGAFVRDYFTPHEQDLVAGGEHDMMANLVWSAKESALKVLRTGLRRDTRTVEVHLGDAVVDGWHALTVHAIEGTEFPGWWARFGDFILTVATTEAAPPPRSVRRPPPLASAVPSHAWMENPLPGV
jgi:4'-phosphopantetheinyl transferase